MSISIKLFAYLKISIFVNFDCITSVGMIVDKS